MKKLLVAFLVFLGLCALGAGTAWWWWNRSLDEYAATPFGSAGEKVVEIPQGATLKGVARRLAEADVISDETRFHWAARRAGKDRQIKAGEYGFAGELLPEKILETVAAGKVKLYQCTVAEGLRSDEIAPILERCGFGSAAGLLALMRDPAFARSLGLKGKSLEGYLYPDTYTFPKNPKPEVVLKKMVERFREEYRKADANRNRSLTFNEHEVATLASIVEKETGAPEERGRIACVYENRLQQGKRLEADPTTIYAMILSGTWRGNLVRADLFMVHPYNTYKVTGLPPGPIANAGGASIEAVLNPSRCNDLFFVACGGGRHVFCPDYNCHTAAIARCQPAPKGK